MKEIPHSIKKLTRLEEYQTLLRAVKNNKSAAVFGVDTQKAYFPLLLASELGKKTFIVVPDDNTARIVQEIMQYGGRSFIYPARDYSFRDIESVSRFEENKRIEALSAVRRGEYESLIITADALVMPIMCPGEYEELILRTGDEVDFDGLPEKLASMGFEFFSAVEGHGQFSVRGGILDIFPPDSEVPYRIEFYGDEIDTVSIFDINTQRRTEPVDQIRIIPAKEYTSDICNHLIEELEPYKEDRKVAKDIDLLQQKILPKHDRYYPAYFKKAASILDYADENTFICVFGYKSVIEHAEGLVFRIKEDMETLLEEGFVFLNKPYYYDKEEIVSKMKVPLIFETLPCSVQGIELDELVNIRLYETSVTTSLLLAEDAASLVADGYNITVLAVDKDHAEDLKKELGISKNIVVQSGAIPFGFNAPDIKEAVFSFRNIRRPEKKKRKSRFQKGEKIKGFSDIHVGDYVVHTNYGIGIYDGIHKVDQQGVVKDFIKIRFAGTDVLYIPCSQLDSISKYIGKDTEINVKLNKLGGTDWSKTKQRVRKAVRDLAKQLIELYGKRLNLRGKSFSPDNEWQREFEASFEFEETDDQLRCISEIKRDMESPHPMDRLLCGDVGFGKTEVAFRAIFKCVTDSRQAAVLAPTTILVFQHYQTMLRRFKGYPIKIEILSRYRSPKQQEEILKKLRKGEIDVVVGTHRLVQKDVQFKDLGLVVIDEEQRFGVAHKEALKEKAPDADFLTLSATPIPRTLNMSLSGIRDISVLNEAPNNRFPVTTYVAEYDLGLISDAIKREVARGGQCFYLHNRIDTIFKTAQILADKTGVRIAVAHGKMSQEELSEIWEDLVNGDTDVLVCTTIIETGVDVPNCNTLIIEDADKLGLAQLHQIRGRVGRTDRRAYAYFTFRRGKTLSTDAYKRLMTIKEFTEFGSGMKIAMRDLEIRGAGDILGAEQSGHLVTVGFDMYMKLLEEAVAEEKGETVRKSECLVDLKVNAYIPDDYIRDTETRIEIYKTIAGMETDEDMSDVIDELIDRFGDPPKEIMMLMNISRIRHAAGLCGFSEVRENNDSVLLFFESAPDLKTVADISAEYKGKILFSAGVKSYLTFKTKSPMIDLPKFLETFLKISTADISAEL
ncbi:MAG: transcription-repair coupling factor [Clostridia bacterium]|nr:transcription-repair coupling factor [Clostridia bacterium]